MATSDHRIDIENYRERNVDVARLEMEFKKDKCRGKSNFTRARNKLLSLIDNHEGPSHRAIEEACRKMDNCMDIVLEVLYNSSDFYLENNDLQKSKKIVCEMEKIEEEFYSAHEAKRDYLDSQRDDQSSILSIDLREKMNICDSRTEMRQATLREVPQTNNEVTSSNLKAYKRPVLPLTLKETTIRCNPIFSEHERNTHEHGPLTSNEIPNINNGRHLLSDTIMGSRYGYANCENTISKQDVQ